MFTTQSGKILKYALNQNDSYIQKLNFEFTVKPSKCAKYLGFIGYFGLFIHISHKPQPNIISISFCKFLSS